MKFFALLFLVVFQLSQANAASISIDKSHSSIQFEVAHLVISSVTGSFKEYDATADYDVKSGKLEKIDVTINPSSIFTDVEKRDAHLKSADFFDVDKFSKITFKSTKTNYKNGKASSIEGDLTIRDVKKVIKLDVEAIGVTKDADSGTHFVLKAKGKINRKDFGLAWNRAIEGGGLTVGEEVTLTIKAEAYIKN